MYFQVVGQRGRLAEFFRANQTLVRLLAGVYLHVVGQGAQLSEQFVAFRTLEGFRAICNLGAGTLHRL